MLISPGNSTLLKAATLGNFMSNDLLRVVLALFFLTCVLVGGANAQTVNLSTDEAVLEQLGKLKNEKFRKEQVCIERLKESARVIVIGSFRNDYGCHFDGAFVNSRFYDSDDVSLSKNALYALGWKKAGRVRRERLAKLWVEKGLLAFFTVLYTKDKDFQKPQVTYRGGHPPKRFEFHPPQVISNENGETVVTLWTSVMRRKKEFHRHEFRFAKDGTLSAGE